MKTNATNIFKTTIKALAFCLSMFVGISSGHAEEITAIDFNGDLIGKVIPDGKVVSLDNQLIGNITADSLIINFDGMLIGGVVPQGIAIGNDNRLLGKVSNDGTVRLSTGKIVGKVLPNGLVVDEKFAVLGSVLFPGLVYSDSGEAIGRLTGDGLYSNLQGQTIGFVSADGYAYRKVGNDFILDGKLISSKMVVDATGNFIGSVTPGGKVTNFDGAAIGIIKANGFAYNDDNQIIGRIVKSGYAFDINGKYIGFVTYNGEVYSSGRLLGRLQIDGTIADTEGNIVGFMADIAATATDASGKYIGRIMPEGKIAQGRNIIGQIGPWNIIYDTTGKEIGKVVVAGPVFDYRGGIKAHGLKNGQVVLLSGTPLGSMYGNIAFDNSGRVIGATFIDKLAIDANNVPIGMNNINSALTVNEDRKITTPFGYVYNSDGVIDGNMLALGSIYSLSGTPIATIYPSGQLMNKGAPAIGKITQYGINIDERNLVIGKNLDVKYAVGPFGESLGILADGNLVLNKSFVPIAKVLPDQSIVPNLSDPTALMPVTGRADSKELALAFDGRLIGYINGSGQVKDLGALTVGKVNSREIVLDNNGVLAGGSLGYAPAINKQCEFIGVVSPQGDIRNYREVSMGRALPNRQVLSETGSVIGYVLNPSSVVDYNGNILGIVSSNGKVLNYNNENLGCIDNRSRLYNAQGALIGKVVEISTAISLDGRIAGRSMLDGSVINNDGQVVGYVRPDDSVSSRTGMPIGMLFKFRFAFDNNNRLMGYVLESGDVVNENKEKLGTIDFEGNVVNRGDKIGYALYDMYIYNQQNDAIGYIASDGSIMSFSNQNLGKLQRGFLVDNSGKIIGRGNRDYFIRDNLNIIIGELRLDGSVVDVKGSAIGTLGVAGDIIANDDQVIATAKPLQYFELEKKQPVYDENGNVVGYVTGDGTTIVDAKGNVIGQLAEDGSAFGLDGTLIGNTKLDWYEAPLTSSNQLPKVGARTVEMEEQYRKSLNIALTPDGEYLGDVLEDGRVIDKNGNTVGRLLPDGLVVDAEGSLIGIEEASKKTEAAGEMFVPAGTFGQGGAYGTGTGGGNLGPGGGFGPGERYDGQRAAALNAAQQARRQNMEVGKISTGISKSAFDGYQKNWDEQGIPKAISSWRVKMDEMIFADKPIPAVIARSIDSNNPAPVTAYVERNVYAEEGRNIIIPAGSRLMGTLGSVTGSGEATSESAKVQITWERLVRPDGIIFVFAGLTGDAQGRGGALGYLDQQLFKKYSLPLATTMLTSATSYMLATDDTGAGENESSRQQAANDARQNFLDQMNQIFMQVLSDKTNIRALTYVPAGTRIIVYPNVDLWLRTPERDMEVSTNDAMKDVLIDDKEAQDRIQSQKAERKIRNAGSARVVYESEETDATAASAGPLIDDNKKSRQQSGAVGAAPPPPPSTGSAKPSGSSGSGSSVPQLF